MQPTEMVPNALVDAYVVGFEGVAVGCAYLLDKLDTHLAGVATISTPMSEKREGYVQLTFDLRIEETDESAGSLRLDLHLRRKGADIVFTNRCSISGNGLLLLRGELGSVNCNGHSFDGKSNFLGADHSGPELTHRQLDLICDAVQYAHAAIDAAFPGWVADRLWIKSAEACRDLPVDNAISAIRIVQQTALCGTIMRNWDEYRRIGDEDSGGVPTLRFYPRQVGPIEKLYPKSVDTARSELVCANRASMRALMGAAAGNFTADSVRDLFLHFLTSAHPRLDRLEHHLNRALASEVSISSLLAALSPLIDRVVGRSKARGPRSMGAQEQAGPALDALLTVGMFDARGSIANHAFRRELDRMCADDGPLQRRAKGAIYYLKPEFARASACLR